MALTRENIRGGFIQEMLRKSGGAMPILSEEEIVASYQATIAAAPPGDIWVFGYGSLIWNPAFHYAEKVIGRVHGYHRRFCLWTQLGRGTAENPGMVLALEQGGSCSGLAFRIAPENIEEEFDVIWRREMVSGAYRPKWMTIRSLDGRHLSGVTFVINHDHPRYAGSVDEATRIKAIATASGPLGRCCDYLFNTVDHLQELGVADKQLARLCQQVRDYQAAR